MLSDAELRARATRRHRHRERLHRDQPRSRVGTRTIRRPTSRARLSPLRATTRRHGRERVDVHRDVVPRRDRRPFRSDRGQSAVRQRRRQARVGRDVRHEPDVALFGGETACAASRPCSTRRSARSRRGGWLVMEFGFGQEDDVSRLGRSARRCGIDRVRADLQGAPLRDGADSTAMSDCLCSARSSQADPGRFVYEDPNGGDPGHQPAGAAARA